jgi:hypothetical protein
MQVASNPDRSAVAVHAPMSESLKQFRFWFGQSKIANEDGTPKLVYHGTNTDFAIFQSRTRNPELGFHFGSVAQAEFFSGYGSQCMRGSLGCIMPVYLRIENPLRMFDIFERGRRSAENVAHWLYRDGTIDKRSRDRIWDARTAREACLRTVMAIEALDYDGIVYGNEWEGGSETNNEDAYIAFRSEQIKSAFNRGTFNRASANILE